MRKLINQMLGSEHEPLWMSISGAAGTLALPFIFALWVVGLGGHL